MNPGNRILRPETLDLLREDLRLRLEAHPDWGDLWNLRGLLSAWEGDLEGARDAFATALERRPGFGAARWNLTWAGIQLGDEYTIEISHHYGLGTFRQTGCLIVTSSKPDAPTSQVTSITTSQIVLELPVEPGNSCS